MAVSFTKNYIGKSLDEGITADDLITYFSTEREESLTLEFKSFYAKDKAVSFEGVLRTVAAFLNSEGGLLVFGAPPDVADRNNYRVVQGAPTPIPTNIVTKDSLVNKISDSISYLPVGIRVEPVRMSTGDFVYLIEVQESGSKPHQCDKRYFVRLDGQSRPAPHYLVEALFKQEKVPELAGYLRVTSYRLNISDIPSVSDSITLQFDVTIFNKTKNVNDTGVYIQMLASLGRFVPDNQTNHIYNGQGLVFVKDAVPVITYALSAKRSFNYEITSDEYKHLFRNEDKTLEIILSFGSLKSVTRSSEYTIKFKTVNVYHIQNNTFTQIIDLQSLMSIEKRENISMNEVWQGDDERVEKVLTGI